MNVQDLIKEADHDKIAAMWCEWVKDNPTYRDWSEAKISETLRKFTDMLSGLKTKPCNDLLYAAYCTDLDEKERVFAFYVEKAEEEKQNHYACVRGDLLILHELKRLADMDIAI